MSNARDHREAARRPVLCTTEAGLMETAYPAVYSKYDYDDQGVQRRT
jgi:hypothetical protein